MDAKGKEYYPYGRPYGYNRNMLVSSLNNVNTQGLLNIADIYNLKQLITEPTRVTPVSSTLIDVIFTSHPDNFFGINDNLLLGEKTFRFFRERRH